MNEYDHRHFSFTRQSGIPRGELDDDRPVVSDRMVFWASAGCFIAALVLVFMWGST